MYQPKCFAQSERERVGGKERERTLLNKEEGMLRYECPRQNSVTQFKDDGVGTNA